jgi:hypothetical protein
MNRAMSVSQKQISVFRLRFERFVITKFIDSELFIDLLCVVKSRGLEGGQSKGGL